MNLSIQYKSGASLTIELLDTPAVKKWLYCFLNNKHLNSMETVYDGWNSGYDNPQVYEIQTRRKDLSIKINDAIEAINSAVDGDKFPYRAKEDMTIIETQLIHRSFTTGMSTGKAWKHGWNIDQLRMFKEMEWPEKRQAFKDLAPEQFKVLDQDTFYKQGHLINDYIHHYEPTIFSQRSKDSFDKKESAAYLMTKFKGAIEGDKDWTILNLTIEELKHSFPGDYSEYDVHMHSNIFGKTYVETYFEYDPAMEFDVTNVENLVGEFHFFPPSKNKNEADFRRCVRNSDWSKWLDGHDLPFYLTRTPPLGKIVGWKNLDDDYKQRVKQLSTEIESIKVLKFLSKLQQL